MASFTHIALLGRQPELGLVELEAQLGAAALQPYGRSAALLDQAVDIDRYGGLVKVARVLSQVPARPVSELLREAEPAITELVEGPGKIVFGLSVYGLRLGSRELRDAAAQVKRALAQNAQASVRHVPAAGRDTALTAAQVRHNKLTSRGFELVLVFAQGQAVLAVTTAVQNIDWYSKRDYDRPARSAKVGMLPPKLAQVLVNTTTSAIVADPFCGTGVVLQEALLVGRQAYGSDLSEEMVQASETNLPWLESAARRSLPTWSVELADARHVALPVGCAVVSEGYLGPNLTTAPSTAQLQAIRSDLEALYRDSLANFARQLPPGGEVSICVPAWRVRGEWRYLDLVDEVGKLGYTLKGFQHVRTPLLYSREDQVVGRQLLLLRKN
jgi:SAM-dependent methyltransferase